jgi:hypothetical protein
MNENFVFNTTSEKTIPKKKNIELFTIIGKHEFLDSDKNPRLNKEDGEVCAKKIITDNNTKFYIKTGLYGKIYDPIGLYSEGTSAKFLSRVGKKAWEFKQVSSKVFDMYLSFLKTKNKAWLTNAERELN